MQKQTIQLTQQEIQDALNPKNLSAADKKLVEAWKEDGVSDERIAELLIFEM